jgi:hypothetical protein
VVGDVGTGELVRGLGQDPGDVDRHVPDADHHCGVAVERRVEVDVVGVAVVPGHEVGGREAAREVLARDAEAPIAGRPVGEHDGVVVRFAARRP